MKRAAKRTHKAKRESVLDRKIKAKRPEVASVRLSPDELEIIKYWMPEAGSPSSALRAFLSHAFKELVI